MRQDRELIGVVVPARRDDGVRQREGWAEQRPFYDNWQTTRQDITRDAVLRLINFNSSFAPACNVNQSASFATTQRRPSVWTAPPNNRFLTRG